MNKLLLWTVFLGNGTAKRLATLGPVGYMRPGPGTWGSLAGLGWYLLLFHYMPILLQLVLIGITLIIAAGICDKAEKAIGRKDPGEVIMDEFAVMPICFLGLQYALQGALLLPGLLAGFAVFRVFDIFKPFGISKLQGQKGGWGVLLDDVAAAMATCALLHGLYWLCRVLGWIG